MQTNSSGPSRGGVGTTLSIALLGTLLLAAATMLSYQHLKPRIERDLTARVATAVPSTGGQSFLIDGQDVILTGTVATAAAKEAAENSAAEVYGVSRVINNLTVEGALAEQTIDQETLAAVTTTDNTTDQATTTPPADQQLVVDNTVKSAPPTLTVVVRDGKVSTQGIVSDNDTIERLNSALAGKFGRGNVKNELSVFADSETPVWIDGMLTMIDQLDGLRDPILKVTGRDLVVGGRVVSEEIRQAKLSTAERLLGSELVIIDNIAVEASEAEAIAEPEAEAEPAIVVQPTTQTPPQQPEPEPVSTAPASLLVQSKGQEITLSGIVGDEADAEALRNGVGNLFGQNGFKDELKIDSTVAKANWLDDALSVISEVRNVAGFGINISGDQMLLSGTTVDREQGRDLSIAATEIAGNKLDVLNNFAIDSNILGLEGDLLAQSLLQELDALPTRNIVFNKNSITLTSRAQQVLDDVAAAILGYEDLVVEIAGHTDSSGEAVRNLRLSKDRAAAVRDYLVSQNVPANRLSPIGYGETAPISDNNTANGRAANRRIEFNL